MRIMPKLHCYLNSLSLLPPSCLTVVPTQVLAINPNWLIFVEGLSYATNLTAVRSCPIVLSIPNRLVYSAHNYAWSYNGSVQASGYGKDDTPTYLQFQRCGHRAVRMDGAMPPLGIQVPCGTLALSQGHDLFLAAP